MNKNHDRKVVNVLDGKREIIPPIWVMRQAGRYLPEYRKTRKEAGSFLDLCYNPQLAIEVTMQPIRRFGFDASILFSDILVIPDAMGIDVKFVEGRGPVLDPLRVEDFDNFKQRNDNWEILEKTLNPVLQAVRGIRDGLPDETTLLGFCGAPWTVATYMIAGHSTSDQAPARLFAHQYPHIMSELLDLLASRSAQYLIAQLKAGADAVQIFDSWAGVLDQDSFEKYCVGPVAKIVHLVRKEISDAKIIGFPKGANLHLMDYVKKTGVNALGLDWTVNENLAKSLQALHPVQGNLDPTRLVAGGSALDEGIDNVLEVLGHGPLIFNLGHGITPDTPVGHVEHLIRRVKG